MHTIYELTFVQAGPGFLEAITTDSSSLIIQARTSELSGVCVFNGDWLFDSQLVNQGQLKSCTDGYTLLRCGIGAFNGDLRFVQAVFEKD